MANIDSILVGVLWFHGDLFSSMTALSQDTGIRLKGTTLCNAKMLLLLSAHSKVMAGTHFLFASPPYYETLYPHAWVACCPVTRGLLTDVAWGTWRKYSDWVLIEAPLKPVTHVAFVWQPSRCSNWVHILPVCAMCSLSSQHSGWCHSTTKPPFFAILPTHWHLCGHPSLSWSPLMKSN